MAFNSTQLSFQFHTSIKVPYAVIVVMNGTGTWNKQLVEGNESFCPSALCPA